MQAHFDIAVDQGRSLVHFELAGFFTLADVAAFDATWRACHATLRCPPNTHVSLCDLTRMSIQTQEVVAAFAAVVRDSRRRARRVAMVVGVSLARHQAKRLHPPERDGVRMFYDRAEAEAWLFSDDRTDALCRHAPASPRSDGHGCTDRSAA